MTANYDRFQLFGDINGKKMSKEEKAARRNNPNIAKRRNRSHLKPSACTVISGEAAQKFL